MNKIFAILAGLIIVLAAILPACSNVNAGTTEPSTGANIGNIAPDFTLFDLSGHQVSLRGFLGRPVVVNFWATD